ncbi:MAG: hypothetical protein ACRD1K_02725 [Acidimicrobiales bacterium]
MNERDAREDIRNVLRRADLLRVAPGLVDRCEDTIVETVFFAINEALVCGHAAVEPVHLLVAAFRQTPAGQSQRPGFVDVDKLCDDVLRRAYASIPVSQEQLDLGNILRERVVADAWERRRGTFARRVRTLPRLTAPGAALIERAVGLAAQVDRPCHGGYIVYALLSSEGLTADALRLEDGPGEVLIARSVADPVWPALLGL